MKATALNRTTRKKLETKDKLLNSFQLLILERGIDAISINDITEKSDIGLGTFYNYFESKKAILDAVSDLFAGYYHRDLDKLTENLEDPAEIFATSAQYTYGKIIDGSLWGKFMFDSGLPVDFYLSMMRSRSSKDINQGLQSGRFKVKADDFILNLSILSGMLISVTGDLYKGHLKPSTLSSIAARSLLQLGLDPDEAEKVADSCTVKIPAQELPLSSYDLEIVKYETKATETLRAI